MVMGKFFVLSAAAAALTAPLGLPGAARAGEIIGGSCSLDSLSFVSVTVGNINKAPPITVPVNMTCRPDRALEEKFRRRGYRIGYCWHVHNTPVNFTYRTVGLTSPNSGSLIKYNFYARNGLRVAGLGTIGNDQYNIMGFASGGNGLYHMADSMTMRFEGNEGPDLKPGEYRFSSSGAFHGAMGAMKPGLTPNPREPWKFCSLDTGLPALNNDIVLKPQITVTPEVKVSVKTYCNIRKPPNADFGKYLTLENVKPVIVPVNVDCSAGTIYRIKVNNGRHAIGGQRYMTLNGGSAPNGRKIAYNVGPVSWSGIGNGTPAGVTEDLNLIVPDQPTPPAGFYKDTLILTLERFAASGDVFAAAYDGSSPKIYRLY